MYASVNLELQIAGEAVGLPAEGEIREWLEETLRAAGPNDGGTCDLVVRIVDEQESRELNNRYRRKDNATNVLAFPAASAEELPDVPEELRSALGDLVLCGPVIAREAVLQGKETSAHWCHVLVHGALHLLGYDHETREQAARMESLETRILAGRGVADPYAAR